MENHPRLSGAGFARFGDVLPLVVTVQRGQSSCTLPAHLLERMLGVPRLEVMLLRLVDPHESHNLEREPTEGVAVPQTKTNENAVHMYIEKPFVPLKEDGGVGEEENTRNGETVGSPEHFAAYLAMKLNDQKSLAWFRMVTRRLDRSLIQDALVRALDIPARDLRRSRGAVFTSLVRPHLRNSKSHSS